MTIGDGVVYRDFDYSLNASKLLNARDGDLEVLLKLYNINQNALEEMIQSVRDWYEKQPHLPQGQLHDRMILGHLMSRGFSVEQSKEKIDNYFSARTRMPDLVGERAPLPPNMGKFLKEGYWVVPPMKTKENHRVLLFRIVNPADMVVLDVAKLGFLMSEYRLFNETSQGDHWIFDFSDATLSHALQFTPLIPKIYYYITSCYAVKIKGLHLVNIPSFGYSILALFKKIMKPKHLERLHIYEGFENIYKVLPKEIFPTDLGGTAKMTVQDISDMWCDTLQSETWQEFYANQEKHFHVDETKRISASKLTDTFGVEGSFRKLELD